MRLLAFNKSPDLTSDNEFQSKVSYIPTARSRDDKNTKKRKTTAVAVSVFSLFFPLICDKI